MMVDNLNQFDLRLNRLREENFKIQSTSDRDWVELTFVGGDVEIIAERANLAQAILNRLYTRQGELAQLGHPSYGSRLHELMGELNNTRTRTLAEIYIRECLGQESRIAEITQIVFNPPSRNLDEINTLKVLISVRPVGEETNFTLSISLNL